jgi:hypothetical protein
LGEIADEKDRQKMVSFAEWCLRYEYGHLTIISISLCLITGWKFIFGMDNRPDTKKSKFSNPLILVRFSRN